MKHQIVTTRFPLPEMSPALPQDSAAYTDTTSEEGVLYKYQVCVTTAAGGRACSKTAGANQPTNLAASYNPGAETSLSWQDNSTDETMFRVMRKDNSVGTWSRIHDAAADATTWTDGTIASGDWSYRVCASNAKVVNCSAVKRVLVP